jgi:type I restriction enzyme R subunit
MTSNNISNTYNVSDFYGDKELRWYQIAAINETIQALERHEKRIAIVLPTGAGKTITAACLLNTPKIRQLLNIPDNRKLKVLFVSHLNRLLTQAEKTFAEETGVELITQSVFSNIPDDVLEQGWDLTMIDECQRESIITFQYKLDKLATKPIIGLTATPIRADNYIIKFSTLVHPISREQAVKEGYLSPTYLYSVITPPSKTKTDIVKDILNDYHHVMDGTLVFMRTKQEVNDINQYLVNQGFKSVAILNQTKIELDNILNEFSQGKYQFIISCNKLGEGVDVKNCSTVLIGRTLGSYPLLNQIIGRAARPDCNCNVFELINPLSKDNLDSTVVVGTPEKHTLIFHRNNSFKEMEFDYTNNFSPI